jgi:hypothetical protein
MKPPEIFQLALRILGLVFLYHGLTPLPVALAQFLSVFRGPNTGQVLFTMLMIAWPLFLAWWLLRGAPQLMRLAYPEAKTTSPDTQPAQNPGTQKTDA